MFIFINYLFMPTINFIIITLDNNKTYIHEYLCGQTYFCQEMY